MEKLVPSNYLPKQLGVTHGHSLFDLLWLTCYKTWSCVMGFGEVAVLCPSHDNSDAAKLSIPVQVLQWKRVRNSGHTLLALLLESLGNDAPGRGNLNPWSSLYRSS